MERRNKIPDLLEEVLLEEGDHGLHPDDDEKKLPLLKPKPFDLEKMLDGKDEDYHDLLVWMCVTFLDNCVGYKTYFPMVRMEKGLFKSMSISDLAFILLVVEAHYKGWKLRTMIAKMNLRKVGRNDDRLSRIDLTTTERQVRYKQIVRALKGKFKNDKNEKTKEESMKARKTFEDLFWKLYNKIKKDEDRNKNTQPVAAAGGGGNDDDGDDSDNDIIEYECITEV